MPKDRASGDGLLYLKEEELRSVLRNVPISDLYCVEDTVFARFMDRQATIFQFFVMFRSETTRLTTSQKKLIGEFKAQGEHKSFIFFDLGETESIYVSRFRI
ncbi:hypothetical protein QE152_g32329 [Popillia japonica]|uniref:Uncharacterized protein n=1 Tax=Popillia japonica TaxID=7064 RepID=A0AAW1IZF2_POPJA